MVFIRSNNSTNEIKVTQQAKQKHKNYLNRKKKILKNEFCSNKLKQKKRESFFVVVVFVEKEPNKLITFLLRHVKFMFADIIWVLTLKYN